MVRGSDKGNLPEKAFLRTNLPYLPRILYFSPLRWGKALQDAVGYILEGDGVVEVAQDVPGGQGSVTVHLCLILTYEKGCDGALLDCLEHDIYLS